MQFDVHAASPDVSVGGPLLPTLHAKIVRVVVEGQRNLPAMCQVEFHDEDSSVADNPLLRPGAPLKVETGAASEDPTQVSLGPLFDGEVVAVEVDYSAAGGKRFVLRGYDKSHRLHRGRKTRTFLMMPDNVIATQIASDVGLTPMVQPTGGPHDYLCQRNQTDWEFLTERARENGFEVGVSMGALMFRKAGANPAAGVPQSLEYGSSLLSFRARVSSAEQPMMTKVTSFNPLLKTPVMGMSVPPVPENTLTDAQFMPVTVAARFGSSDDAHTATPIDLPPGALALATARRAHAASASIEAEGIATGNPALVPGGKIKVEGAGISFGGTYTLSTVRHEFDERGYRTCFTVSGVHDRSLLGLTQPGIATRANGHSSGGSTRMDAPVIAKVSNTNDPMFMGRVKVDLPWMADTAESNWAYVVSVGAGSGKGLQVIPEVGDTVLVAFEQGDVRRPYVLGGIYNTQDLMPSGPAPPPVLNGKTNIRTFKTRAGHELKFDDTDAMHAVSLTTAGGAKIAITDLPTEKIEVSDKSGQNTITIDATAQKISIAAAVAIELKSNATLKIESNAALDVKTTGNLNLEGSIVNIKSNGPLVMQGTPLKLN